MVEGYHPAAQAKRGSRGYHLARLCRGSLFATHLGRGACTGSKRIDRSFEPCPLACPLLRRQSLAKSTAQALHSESSQWRLLNARSRSDIPAELGSG